MWITGRGLWIGLLIVGILQLTLFASHGKVADAGADSTQQTGSLKPPATGKINVAFLISEGADVMDIAGPWEVFGDSMLTTKASHGIHRTLTTW